MLKRLAGDTAIYGIPSIIGRLLNVLLVPLHTAILDLPEYGVVQLLYAGIPLFFAILIFRLETAFFRFGTREFSMERVFSTTFGTLLLTTPILVLIVCWFARDLAGWLLSDTGLTDLIYLSAGIILFDVLCELPYARLRLQNRARTFSAIRMANIGVNILLNLFFLLLCPWLLDRLAPGGGLHSFIEQLYDPEHPFFYIFLANFAASVVAFLLLMVVTYKGKRTDGTVASFSLPKVEWAVLRPMLLYAAPLVLAGLAGIANETLDRILLKFLLPLSDPEAVQAEIGVYGACYKLAMFMALFTQAYRYAAEPIFFREAKNLDAPAKYALMAEYFSIVGAAAFLIVNVYVDLFAWFLIDEKFWIGLGIVPIVLLANLMLGLYYNAAVWFKVTDRTGYGAIFALVGAAVTIGLNWLLIPRIGYYGSAWATLACYSVMLALCYLFGQKFYPIPYRIGRIAGYATSAVAIYLLLDFFKASTQWSEILYYSIATVLVLVWSFGVYRLVRSGLRNPGGMEV